jgi:hypothetical protein
MEELSTSNAGNSSEGGYENVWLSLREELVGREERVARSHLRLDLSRRSVVRNVVQVSCYEESGGW